MNKYNAAVEKRDKLAEQVNTCERKLGLAKAVISGLAGEKTRWAATASQQLVHLQHMTGDLLISCAALAYQGAFTGKFDVSGSVNAVYAISLSYYLGIELK
jgi:dynein heavy chain